MGDFVRDTYLSWEEKKCVTIQSRVEEEDKGLKESSSITNQDSKEEAGEKPTQHISYTMTMQSRFYK